MREQQPNQIYPLYAKKSMIETFILLYDLEDIRERNGSLTWKRGEKNMKAEEKKQCGNVENNNTNNGEKMSNVIADYSKEIDELEYKIEFDFWDLIKDENWEINRMLKERNKLAAKNGREEMTYKNIFNRILLDLKVMIK